MSDTEEANLPDGATCQQLCEQFADITQTDTIFAQIFLQGTEWNLEAALADYFESSQETEPNPTVRENPVAEDLTNTNSRREPINNLKFITWNTDGLDNKNLILRIKCICKTIKSENADIVFLQEVVPQTSEVITTSLPDYKCVLGGDEGYFTLTLLKKSSVLYVRHEVHRFPDSRMQRGLLQVEIKINDTPFVLLNSHLESSGEASMERTRQLRTTFEKISNISNEKMVIFAGDLNLRDKELQSVGLPPEIDDMWALCGSRKECAYTWDMTRNDNVTYNSGSHFKPRFRFDRVYIRHSSPSIVMPKYFGLIGLERLKPHRCFPSDHWGILCHFDLNS